MRTKLIETGVTEGQLERIGKALMGWAEDVDGVFAVLQYEVVAPA
jgi:hypothetical protein